MAQYKVYITDYEYETLDYEIREISKINAELIPVQCKTEADVIDLASDADALLVQYAPITRKVFEKLKNLKIVSRYGVGVDSIDLAAAGEHNVCVVNVPDYGVAEVSDHAMSLLLSVIRKINLLTNDIKNKGWDFKIAKPISRLNQLTLAVVGMGRIGKEVIKKARPFGFKILVYDPYIDEKQINEGGAQKVDFEALLSNADIVSLHAPLYEKTRHLLDQQAFSKMKKGAIIINTARGGLIEQSALIEALDNGTIAGAGLDVLEREPIALNSQLKKMDHVILTPHIAWYSQQAQVDLQTKAAAEVVRFLSGEPPLNPVRNREF